MKIVKFLTLLSAFILIASTGFAQQNGHQHTEHLEILIDKYLEVKQALASDDFSEAKTHMEVFRKEATENREMNIHGEHAEMHAYHHGSMVAAIKSATGSNTIETFGTSFQSVTDNLIKALGNQGYGRDTLYLQYCPMALDGKGASWISESKEVRNPYLGQQMLKCGIEKEVLSNEQQ